MTQGTHAPRRTAPGAAAALVLIAAATAAAQPPDVATIVSRMKQAVEPAQRWYYTRIVTTVAADSFLPIERQFYDPANQLWKVERFQGVSTINGVPTVLTLSMDDVQAKSRTTITVTDLKYGARIPEALL